MAAGWRVPVLVLALGAAVRGGPGPVTCGSVVKLLNVRHNVRLHSHDVRYGSGNGTPASPPVPALAPVGPGRAEPVLSAVLPSRQAAGSSR